jgi:hypothetical protein
VIDRPSPLAAFSPSGEAGQHRVDHRVERQPAVDVQFGGEPISAYTTLSAARSSTHSNGHPYSASGVCITPTVCANGSRYRSSDPLCAAVRKNVAKPSTSVAGQVLVPGLRGEVEDGGGAQSTVEVVVQQRLGRPPDRVEGQRARHVAIRSMMSGPMSGAVSPTLQPPSISAIAPSKRSGVSV